MFYKGQMDSCPYQELLEAEEALLEGEKRQLRAETLAVEELLKELAAAEGERHIVFCFLSLMRLPSAPPVMTYCPHSCRPCVIVVS